jgi:hypothetical protein
VNKYILVQQQVHLLSTLVFRDASNYSAAFVFHTYIFELRVEHAFLSRRRVRININKSGRAARAVIIVIIISSSRGAHDRKSETGTKNETRAQTQQHKTDNYMRPDALLQNFSLLCVNDEIYCSSLLCLLRWKLAASSDSINNLFIVLRSIGAEKRKEASHVCVDITIIDTLES